MSVKTIRKSIEILAPRGAVWTVLLDHDHYRTWTSAFSPTSDVETDWRTGSKVIFKDGEGHGMTGRIVENVPEERIVMAYDGVLSGGKEERESDEAKALQGAREAYFLSENAGITRLSIESDMTEEWFDAIAEAWDKALAKVKELSEGLQASGGVRESSSRYEATDTGGP